MLKFFILFVCAWVVRGENCPSGGEIYVRGISLQGITEVLNAHNNFRLQIANGTVPGQPRGVNLKRMKYDTILGTKARAVSNLCKMVHVTINDDRFSYVGQNIYITWSNVKSTNEEWNRAVTKWFNEHKNFVYPTTSNGMTGHYTQVVWADSSYLGCDFIVFNDTNKPLKPYAKMYTCNYGPGGNYRGVAPYKTGTSGCVKLC